MQLKVIKNYLIDLDGVILDIKYDTFFWGKHIPRVYSDIHNIDYAEAKTITTQLFNLKRKTKDWYDIDYWSNMLSIDIQKEKEKEDNMKLISLLDGSKKFLEKLKEQEKEPYLVTNAHRKTLNIKLKKYSLKNYFKEMICSHELGYIKEEIQFWHILKNKLGIDFQHTVLIEDTVDNLKAASSAGLENLVYIGEDIPLSGKTSLLSVKSLSDLSSTF